MKITYEIIKKNLEVFNLAKETIPAISQYENGDITSSAMRSLNLGMFADFSDFLIRVKKDGYEVIIDDMNWRKLKPILIEKTDSVRLKKYISNKTQRNFIELLGDAVTYDRLLNGSWKRRPKYTRRGRLGSGLRNDEYLEGLYRGVIPIVNFIIQNEVDCFLSKKVGDIEIPSFQFQDKYSHDLRWFVNQRLSLDVVPYREIEVTTKLINNFVDILETLKIDHRKLNLEYIQNNITERLKKSMKVPSGTNVKCLRDIFDGSSRKIYTKDNIYSVIDSYVSGGSLMIYVKNDLDNKSYMKYVDFEDMSLHRDNLLSGLFGD